jgi:hypothetical protein
MQSDAAERGGSDDLHTYPLTCGQRGSAVEQLLARVM